MPCYDPGPTEEETRLVYYKEFEHNSELAEMLCELMRRIEKVDGHEGHVSQEILAWWRDHQERDRKRVEKELKEAEEQGAKEAALNKLSQYEKDLLGLK